MIEAGANEVEESLMLKCISKAHEEIKKAIEFVNEISKKCGKDKAIYESKAVPQDLFEAIKSEFCEDFKESLNILDKDERNKKMKTIIEKVHEKFDETTESTENIKTLVDECVYNLQKEIVRNWLKQGKRVDGTQKGFVK